MSLNTGVCSFLSLPSVDAGFDVTPKHLGQIMVAVKLVVVGDTSESLDSVKHRHGQAPVDEIAVGVSAVGINNLN